MPSRFLNGRTAWRMAAIVLTALVATAAPSAAQGFGVALGAGAAFVEDHRGPLRSATLSFLLPIGESVLGSVSYSGWRKRDATGDVDGSFTGNGGINLTFYAPLVRTSRFAWMLGAGVGQYERVVRAAGATDREYQGALTASTMVALGLGERWSLVLKGDASAPTAETTPRWGFVHAGLALRLH